MTEPQCLAQQIADTPKLHPADWVHWNYLAVAAGYKLGQATTREEIAIAAIQLDRTVTELAAAKWQAHLARKNAEKAKANEADRTHNPRA